MRKPVVLVIDDDEFYREVLSDLFNNEKVEVFTAGDGEQGFRLYQEVMPDLVILDRIMPRSGGTRFLMNVKDRNNRRETTLIIYSQTIGKRDAKFSYMTAAPPGFARALEVAKSTTPQALVKKAITLLESAERSESG